MSDAHRRRLPDTRRCVTHKFRVDSFKIYARVGLYEDGTPAELFLNLGKTGGTLSGILNDFSIAVSMCLQHGVSLESLANKFIGQRYEPMGRTFNPQIPEASSITDYVFKWMMIQFPKTTSDLKESVK